MSPRTLASSSVLFVLVAVIGWKVTIGPGVRTVAPARAVPSPEVAAPTTGSEIEPPEMQIGEPSGRIFFTSYRVGNASQIFAMHADGSHVTPLKLGGSAAGSPDGELVACVQFYLDTNCFEIVLLDAAGNLIERLTETPEEDSTAPAWSPDGSQIAFQSGDFNKPSIYVMNADGTGRTALTAALGNDRHPCWSPNGDWIAFSSHRDGSEGVFVMDAEGGQLRRLTDASSSCGDPAWSPTGNRIACVAYHRSNRSYSSEDRGRRFRRLVDGDQGSGANLRSGLVAFR